jgi:hypothetical protein
MGAFFENQGLKTAKTGFVWSKLGVLAFFVGLILF